MKAVLISIQPRWCEKIATGEKTVEVRKTKPKIATPFKVYIYCTLPPKEELFGHGGIYEYANELIRLQSGEVVYDYGMRLCCDPEGRPYTSDNFLCRKVIGEFVCDKVVEFPNEPYDPGFDETANCACLDEMKLYEYLGSRQTGYGWHISELKIYDKPKRLSDFERPCKCLAEYEGELYCDCLNCDNAGDSDYGITACDRKQRKPPQSWCYVEDLNYGK